MNVRSLRVGGPLLVLVPVAAAVLALGAVATWQGRRVVDAFAARSIRQSVGELERDVNGYLENAVLTSDYAARTIERGRLDRDHVRDWRPALHDQLAANPHVNSVTFGAPSGDATWVIRYPDEDALEYAVRDGDTDGEVVEYRLEPDGSLGGRLGAYAYDPRKRPWYQAATEAGEPTWSPVYPWVRRAGGGATLGIAYARPLTDPEGRFAGVVDSDIGLSDLSRFLQRARPTEGAEALLFDREGQLIAASTGAAVVGKEGARVQVADSADRLIADVGAALSGAPADGAERRLRAGGDGGEYRLVTRPLEDPWGLDWSLALAIPEAELQGGVDRLRRQAWLLAAAAALGALIVGWLASRSLTRPVTALADHVRRIGGGGLDEPVDVGGYAEFALLSDELNRMRIALKDRLKLRHSLSLAMEIQQRLLPDDAPTIPGLDVAGHSTYCDETGGDYYDFLETGETDSHDLIVVLGDVMGHGIAAALLMATARGVLRSKAQEPGSLGQLLTHVNGLLVEDTGGERFMTMVLLVVDPKRRSVRFAVAGHDAPLLVGPADGATPPALPDAGGLPLGLMEVDPYDEVRVDGFDAGQVLLVGTDGLWETQNAAGDFYGKERLEAVLRDHLDRPAEEISEAVVRSVSEFRGAATQDDDVTFVVIKFVDAP